MMHACREKNDQKKGIEIERDTKLYQFQDGHFNGLHTCLLAYLHCPIVVNHK